MSDPTDQPAQLVIEVDSSQLAETLRLLEELKVAADAARIAVDALDASVDTLASPPLGKRVFARISALIARAAGRV